MKTIFLGLIILIFLGTGFVHAGPYTNSAHGNATNGVDRKSPFPDYAVGNCAHCHEQHAMIGGAEPEPSSGTSPPTASKFCLFADNFNTSVTTGPYIQADNFCFYCHTETLGSFQDGGGITNHDHSKTFGGYDTILTSGILEVFNQGVSYHNLNDVLNFAKGEWPATFGDNSNPCAVCHNVHKAKRNKAHTGDPAYTAISRPSDHDELWGDSADNSEKMSKYTTYRPPYYNSETTYEPDGGTVMHDGSKMPDYNTFCLDCHQNEVTSTKSSSMNPNTTPGKLTAIDWSSNGDMHGQRPRIYDVDGTGNSRTGTIINPYHDNPADNYVLSCLDCHEPHGSVLVRIPADPLPSYLLRKEVNNNLVNGCGPGHVPTYFCESVFCGSCHTFAHCGGPLYCFGCHYHGAENIACGGPWTGPNF